MQPFELQKCLTLSGESVKCASFLFDNIDTSKVLLYVGTSKGTLTAYHINRQATLPTDGRNDYGAEELCSQVRCLRCMLCGHTTCDRRGTGQW